MCSHGFEVYIIHKIVFTRRSHIAYFHTVYTPKISPTHPPNYVWEFEAIMTSVLCLQFGAGVV